MIVEGKSAASEGLHGLVLHDHEIEFQPRRFDSCTLVSSRKGLGL